jgi:hypothetical protein
MAFKRSALHEIGKGRRMVEQARRSELPRDRVGLSFFVGEMNV